jgi:hypothetical protein
MKIDQVGNAVSSFPGRSEREVDESRRRKIDQIEPLRCDQRAAAPTHRQQRPPAMGSRPQRLEQRPRNRTDLVGANVRRKEPTCITFDDILTDLARARREHLDIPTQARQLPRQHPCPLHVRDDRRIERADDQENPPPPGGS